MGILRLTNLLCCLFCVSSVFIGGCSPEPPGRETRTGRAQSSDAPPGPENVVLIVNESSRESREISGYYASRRSIPDRNICTIETNPVEEIGRDTYAAEIEQPVSECLESRQLVERALCLVTTLGVPLKVRGSFGRQATAAAVDSELTLLYAKLHGERVETPGSRANPYFGRRDETFRHPRFPMYLVTRLAAYEVEDVKAMIDRALAAGDEGRVVLDLKSEADAPGNNWLLTAAILLPEGRVRLEESEQVAYDEKDVIGYASWGSNDPNRKRRRLGFGWLPGAIATTYVSTNGRTFMRPPADWAFGEWGNSDTHFADSPQSLTADLIADGATGASGHVYEPFLQATPRPDYLFPAYLDGRTLAESYYLSIPRLSWMNIVVGDPLCRLKSR